MKEERNRLDLGTIGSKRNGKDKDSKEQKSLMIPSGAKEKAASWCRRSLLLFFFFVVVVVNKQSLAFFIIKTLAVGWRVTKPRSFVSATM